MSLIDDEREARDLIFLSALRSFIAYLMSYFHHLMLPVNMDVNAANKFKLDSKDVTPNKAKIPK